MIGKMNSAIDAVVAKEPDIVVCVTAQTDVLNASGQHGQNRDRISEAVRDAESIDAEVDISIIAPEAIRPAAIDDYITDLHAVSTANVVTADGLGVNIGDSAVLQGQRSSSGIIDKGIVITVLISEPAVVKLTVGKAGIAVIVEIDAIPIVLSSCRAVEDDGILCRAMSRQSA